MTSEHYKLYSFPPEKNEKITESSVFILNHPGSLVALGPVINDFKAKNIPIFLQLTGLAEESLTKKLSLTPISEVNECATIIISAGLVDEQVTQTTLLKEKFPLAKIIIVEDSPHSTKPLMQKLIHSQLTPNLWLVPTRRQAHIYKIDFAELAEKTPIIPLGMPGMDSLVDQVHSHQIDMGKQKIETREKLSIPIDGFVVTFTGLPSGDIQTVVTNEALPDLNSVTLKNVFQSLIILAEQNPGKNIYFIYKPHPREKEELWEHPNLLGKLPVNLYLRQYSKERWQELQQEGVNTSSVSLTANIQLSPVSTVNHETAISSALYPDNNLAQPFFTMFKEVQQAFSPDTLSMLITPLTPAIYTPDELVKVLEASLLSPTKDHMFKKIAKEMMDKSDQLSAQSEYRLKGKAGPRVYLWLRALQRWGAEKLS